MNAGLPADEIARQKARERAKAQYWADPAAKKAYDIEYRRANREKINARYKAWRQRNLDEQKAKEAARRAAEPEKYAETAKAWRAKNAEKLRAYEAARAKTTGRRAITRKCSEAWKVANPEARRNHVRTRRARIAEVGGVLSKNIEAKLLQLQRGKCVVCQVALGAARHVDHILPIALGGANVDDNVQLLCPPCNQSKGAKHPVEFMQSRGALL